MTLAPHSRKAVTLIGPSATQRTSPRSPISGKLLLSNLNPLINGSHMRNGYRNSKGPFSFHGCVLGTLNFNFIKMEYNIIKSSPELNSSIDLN